MEWILIILMLKNGELVKEEQLMASRNACEMKAAFLQEMYETDPKFSKRTDIHMRVKCLGSARKENA